MPALLALGAFLGPAVPAQGDVLQDLRHGNGTHTCSNGDHYTGSWRMDKRDGHGRATFVSGLEYEGAWMDDKTHG